MDDGGADPIERARKAVSNGELVVYPTETVYGLGADALREDTINRVFEAKGRDRSDPISLGVPSVRAATQYVEATDRERAFMDEFLPGPVTVVVEKRPIVPDALTGGRERVGVRVPDHGLAQRLLEATGPLTATSANVSGRPSVTDVEALDDEIRAAASVVLDGGQTGGSGSTVVDVSAGVIHREGPRATAIGQWLADHE